MRYGAAARSPAAVHKLWTLGFHYGEVVMSGWGSLRTWWEAGVKSPRSDGFFLVAHGPIVEDDPADLGRIRRNYLPELIATVDAAARVGIELLTVHYCLDSRLLSRFVVAEKRRAVRELVAHGLRQGVTICMENMSESANDIAAALEEVPDLKITLDVGHGQLYRPTNTAFEIIQLAGSAIRHVHLHDNHGGDTYKDDLHLPPGLGSIDLRGICRDLMHSGYDGTMTLEVGSGHLEASLDTIRSLIGDIRRDVARSRRSNRPTPGKP